MAKIIDGKAISQQLLDDVHRQLKEIQAKVPGFKPTLAIIQVGDRSDSNVYIANKLRKAAEIGLDARLVKLSNTTTQSELEAQIDSLNWDDEVDGIILQIDVDECIDRICHSKDVDGLTRENAGRLMRGELSQTVLPCTPHGCLHLIQIATGEPDYVHGKRVVVVGRSKIVGSPAAALFMWKNGTTTICHSKTVDLREQCRQADILIVAIGQKEMIRGDWIKPGAVVVDCGINVDEKGGGGGGGGKKKLYGDVCFEEAKQVASYITPVPGGVGPMTVAMLIKNTFQQSLSRFRCMQKSHSTRWELSTLALHIKSPVPSDIVISRAQVPNAIDQLAREIGLRPDEVELYGRTKAKISLKVLQRLSNRPNGKYVVVGGITPTPLGEVQGKDPCAQAKMVVNYCCPMCETELANTDDYRTHVHGYTSHGQYHTPTCKIGKEKFWGAKKEAAELTDAVAHPREQDDLDKAINDIRRSKLPMREKWCILVNKLRELGLLEGPRDGVEEARDTSQAAEEGLNTSREEEGSGDEEPAPKK